MENEKLTYINSRGERLELGVDSVYHCNISKDVEGISGVTSVIYSTNSMGQHGDTYVGQRIEARDIDVVGHINTRDKAQALELRRRMLKIFNPELSATLVYEYGGFKELLSAYTEFMAKIKLFQSDAENEFNTWFESIKDKLGEDIAGSLQLQIEELAAAMQEVKKQAEAGTKETKEAIAALDERLKRVESGWGIDYKHDAVLGLCYMGAAYMSQHYERTVETAVLGATYVGNSYLANTF